MGNIPDRERDMTAPADRIYFQGLSGAGKQTLQEKLFNVPSKHGSVPNLRDDGLSGEGQKTLQNKLVPFPFIHGITPNLGDNGLSGASQKTLLNNLVPFPFIHGITPNLRDYGWAQSMKKYNVSVETKSRDQEQQEHLNRVMAAGRTAVHPVRLETIDAIVFVVDSANTTNIKNVRYELHTSLQEAQVRGVKFLILANKQDLPEALSVKELSKKLQLHKMKQQGSVVPVVVPAIFGTSALTGEGIHEATEWLFNALDEKRLNMKKQVMYQRKRPRNEERDVTVSEPSNKIQRQMQIQMQMQIQQMQMQIQKPQMAMAGWIQKARDYASVTMWKDILPKG